MPLYAIGDIQGCHAEFCELLTLIDYEALGREAILWIPTPDHYLPLLYVLATRQSREPVTFPVEGVDGGSISMLAAKIG